jgi:mRNA interferase RelE/StbE
MFEINLSKKALSFYQNTSKKNARILNRCFENLANNPYVHANIKKLHGIYEGSFRYRAGKLRIIYSINEIKKIIIIELIVSRENAYKQ